MVNTLWQNILSVAFKETIIGNNTNVGMVQVYIVKLCVFIHSALARIVIKMECNLYGLHENISIMSIHDMIIVQWNYLLEKNAVCTWNSFPNDHAVTTQHAMYCCTIAWFILIETRLVLHFYSMPGVIQYDDYMVVQNLFQQ